MTQPFCDHIIKLEHRIRALSAELTRPALLSEERARIEMKVRLCQLALRYYVKAFDLERESE